VQKLTDKKIISRGSLASLTVPANLTYLPIIQNLATSISDWFGFEGTELQNIELLVEEAFVSEIENSFDPDEYGEISFRVNYRPGKLLFSFEDKGLPVSEELLEKSESSSLGILIIKHLADEFHFVNLGKEGKRIEIVKNVPQANLTEFLNSLPEPEEQPLAQPDEELHFQMMEPKYATDLARLTYRVYGYTYLGLAYLPDKLIEQLEFGYLKAVIVFNSAGVLIGHLGLFFDSPGAMVADSGMAIVDPRYRGHSLFKRMKEYALEHGKKIGLYGIYSESVTIHPYTQKGNITLGAKEIGCLVAFADSHIQFKKINEDGLPQRQAVMLFYLKIGEEPERTVYLPEIYTDIISDIYQTSGIRRKIVTLKNYRNLFDLTGESVIETAFKPDFNFAVIRVSKFGEDILTLIRQSVKELCFKKTDTIFLELPLSDPGTMMLTHKFREFGFFFGGVIPEFRDGDILKLQYLNNIYINPEIIIVASDRGRKILSYIFEDKEKAGKQ